MKRLLAALPVVILAGGLLADPPSPRKHAVVILHTNDLHGHVYPQKGTWIDKANPPEVGGFAAMAALIRRERAKEWASGNDVLLVDAGDWFQGTPEGDIPRGRLVIEWMNLVGYDCAEIGNHEFDKGPETVADLARVARFPFLGANIETDEGKRPRWVHDWATFTVSGVKITFVGLLTSSMDTLVMPEARQGLVFKDEFGTLAPILKSHDEIVIPVTHCGVEFDRKLAARVKVPAIVGGHSHTGIPNPVPDTTTGTLVCQCFAHGTVLGRIELDFADETLVKVSAGHLPVRPADGEDPESKALIARTAKDIDEKMNVEVGEAVEAMTRNAKGSSPLGNWVCDVMREAAGAQVALTNRTGIRADLAAGKIRLRDMYEISPFSNTLTAMDVSGADLKAILEFSTGAQPTFLEVSGLECVIDPAAAEGSRVTLTTVAGEPWDASRTYRIVTNSFLAKGGDGHLGFTRGKNVSETGIDMLDAQVARCKKGKVTPPAEERVKIR